MFLPISSTPPRGMIFNFPFGDTSKNSSFCLKSLAAYLFADRSQPRWGKSDRLLPPHAKKEVQEKQANPPGRILPRAVPARAKGAKAAIRLYPAPAAKSSPRIAHRTPSARAASTRSWRGLPCGFSPVRARCAARRRQKSISLIIPVFGSLRKLTIDWLPRAGAKSAALRSAESTPCDA